MDLKMKKTLCLLIGIISILTIVGTISYAYFIATAEMTPVEATLTTGTTRVRFDDNDNGVVAQLNFGEYITKKFTIENTGTLEANVKMYWDNLINTYIEGSLTYTLSYAESESEPYTEIVSKSNVPQSHYTSKKTLANKLSIPVGQTYYYELTITLNYLSDVNQDADLNAVFNTSFVLEDIHYTNIIEDIIATSQGEKMNFDEPATTDEGVFEMEDDYGTSYYYRGAVTNNYVQFAGFYWRIVRVNGDGTLRIIYDGTSPYANGQSNSDRVIGTYAFNARNDDAKYNGWQYGGPLGTASTSKEQAQSNETDSNAKKIVDEWYKTNIIDKGYAAAVADALFCNDRMTFDEAGKVWTSDTTLGYGNNNTAYNGFTKIYGVNGYEAAPKTVAYYTCPQKNDSFTVDDVIKGNGQLSYPVGLLTIDEVVAAGSGKSGSTNANYYLNKGTFYWTQSPSNIYNSSVGILGVYYNGGITNYSASDSNVGIAPVINLKAEYTSTLIGDGTMENPYREA